MVAIRPVTFKRLKQIYASAPTPELKIKIANVLFLADVTPIDGVTTNEEEVEEADTPLTLLQDSSDEFVTLMRTLPEDAELRKAINEYDKLVSKSQKALQDIGKELSDVLHLEEDDEEMAALANSDLGRLSSSLESYSGDLSDFIELGGIMKSLSGEAKADEKHKPVEHKVKKKTKLGPKKDKKEEPEAPDEDKTKKDIDKLDELLDK